MDEAARAERTTLLGIGKDFYTVSEAAKALGVGQRRILRMLETEEIEGERDPTSGRWKVPKQAVHELAVGETPGAKEPPLAEEGASKPPTTEETQEATEESPLDGRLPPGEDSAGRSSKHSGQEMRERLAELERLNDRLKHGHRAEKATWQTEKDSLLDAADRERRHAERLQEEVAGLRTELEMSQERVERLEGLNERLRLEHQAEKAAWQEERRSLLAAANREHQRTEALQKGVAKLDSELEESRQRTAKLERLNERLRQGQQAKEAAWREEKESLLAALDRERQHAQRLQEEAEMLSTELEIERRRRPWRRLLKK